ncbi:Innexin [Fasciola hepatica]|uniref:Innexin n=1 Tax=Fasciola hepatica TaxID=6192 RepID=A0A2H1CMZ7_FASHE|nr:Innexin [Fasciola hepatica]
MVGQEFINLYEKISVLNRVGIEDFSDRLNMFTVILFCLAAIVVGVKQYVFSSLSCYIPVGPSGEQYKDFLNAYCWVHGTIPLRVNELMPDNENSWDEYDHHRRICKSPAGSPLLKMVLTKSY